MWKYDRNNKRFLFQVRWTTKDGLVGYTGPAELSVDREELAGGAAASPNAQPNGEKLTEFEISLPATISSVTLGGAGRYLIAHLGIQSQAMVVDLLRREPVLTIDAPASSLLAANQDTLIIASAGNNRFERWSLAGRKKEAGGTMPVLGPVKAIAMGHASHGPLLVFWVGGPRGSSQGFHSVVDVRTMRSQLISLVERRSVPGLPRFRSGDEDMEVRAAANGSAFGVWTTNRSPSGVEILFPGRQPLAVYDHSSLGFLLPTADGRGLCTTKGFLSIDLVRKRGSDPCIPGTTPEYFLAFSKRGIEICHCADGSPLRTLALTERFFDGRGLLAGTLPVDQRFHLIPQLDLLVLIPPSNDRLVLATVPLEGSGFGGESDAKKSAPKRAVTPKSTKDEDGANKREEPIRTWTDSTGKFRIRARLEGVDEESVHLCREDGELVTVPLERLGKGDRVYAELYRSRTKREDGSQDK